MSIATPLTRLAIIGGIAALGYSAIAGGGLPFGGQPAPIEQGYVNPKNVKIYSSVNDKGNREAFLSYENGETTLKLPIFAGPNGPLVGDAGYYWSSISSEKKSGLVEGSWNNLQLGTRKSILKGELEKMIENYGTGGEK